MAAVPPEGEENSEPLKYKTWVLKVSVHCEGCKRKVKRILHSVDGVYTIDVDMKQQKVTVTGNVDSNTLIRKLEKSGKNAELFPDSHKKPKKNENPSQDQQEQVEVQGIQNNPTVNIEEAQKNCENSNGVAENSNSKSDKGNNGNDNHEGNIPATGEEKTPPENGGNSGGCGDGGKKKKKKKGNNGGGNNSNNNNSNVEGAGEKQQPNGRPPSTESPPPQQAQGPSPSPNPNPNPNPVNMSPPRHPQENRVYEYPPPAYYGPPPVYAVSYSTAYPSSSYTASFYPAPPPYSSAYVHHGGVVELPPPSDWNPHSLHLQPSDTFEMFSDENPNACSVM